ncbi:hypothetical protein C8F04DRAFT_1397581 [Mycena alexandri]|uniref:Uncharacterized protein n=1 Tax=Mycena alexandri TaxID=1745969 RepID=A0AAD6SP46_9AGAR|nr:hypothetical protein C8F04DRAFT_1397581 [Mycena alexandri]
MDDRYVLLCAAWLGSLHNAPLMSFPKDMMRAVDSHSRDFGVVAYRAKSMWIIVRCVLGYHPLNVMVMNTTVLWLTHVHIPSLRTRGRRRPTRRWYLHDVGCSCEGHAVALRDGAFRSVVRDL